MITNRARISIETLGCKLNQAESENLARLLSGRGHVVVGADEKPDVYILNSCTITHIADRKCRNFLRRARRLNPQAFVVATGCYASRTPEELGAIDSVDLVLNGRDRDGLLEALQLPGSPEHGKANLLHLPRTRAFVKIQEGCATPCTYCIVPRVRGSEISLSTEIIIRDIQDRIASGCLEVVLTGTKVGTYAYDGVLLEGLLEQILAVKGVKRLRLSSLQPWEVNDELLSMWNDGRLCRHFHLPLQSGSEGVLRRMGRRYTTEGYKRAVTLIRSKLSDASITTDVMVGFPGETVGEHRESMSFCEEMAFAAIHVFPYSIRPGTPAADMPEQVNDSASKRRTEEMLKLARDSRRGFQERFLGRAMDVLWENRMDSTDDTWSGLTDNYIRVLTRSEESLTNNILSTQLENCVDGAVWGEVVKSPCA